MLTLRTQRLGEQGGTLNPRRRKVRFSSARTSHSFRLDQLLVISILMTRWEELRSRFSKDGGLEQDEGAELAGVVGRP